MSDYKHARTLPLVWDLKLNNRDMHIIVRVLTSSICFAFVAKRENDCRCKENKGIRVDIRFSECT